MSKFDEETFDKTSAIEEATKETDARILKMEARRGQVADLFFYQRMTQQEIAKIFGVHVQTIKNDVKAIKASSTKELAEDSVQEIIAENISAYRRTIQEAFLNYNTITEPGRSTEKLKYLELFSN